MQKRVVLHIGAMKTGTTYLQAMLKSNTEILADAGYLNAQSLAYLNTAVTQVLARPNTPEARRRWESLCARIEASGHQSTLLSSEFLSFARPHQIRALMAPLNGLTVDVVLVVRDQVGAIASQWQTFCRNNGDATWPDYLRQIDPTRGGSEATKSWRTYYRGQELDRIIADWTAHPGVNHLSILTLPRSHSEPRALWHSFADAAGLGRLGVTDPDRQVNPSVGYASAQLLQDLGAHWRKAGIPVSRLRPAMRASITEGLVPRRSVEGTPQLDQAGWEFARRRNGLTLEAIATATAGGRATVLGDLADLGVDRPPPAGLLPKAAAVPKRQVKEAAQTLWATAHAQASLRLPRRPLTYTGLLTSIAATLPHTPAWQEAFTRRSTRVQV